MNRIRMTLKERISTDEGKNLTAEIGGRVDGWTGGQVLDS